MVGVVVVVVGGGGGGWWWMVAVVVGGVVPPAPVRPHTSANVYSHSLKIRTSNNTLLSVIICLGLGSVGEGNREGARHQYHHTPGNPWASQGVGGYIYIYIYNLLYIYMYIHENISIQSSPKNK